MKYFGTDGIRGIINQDLKVEVLMKIGKAISTLNINKMYIGYDTRESNSLVLFSLVSGLLSKGIEVIDVGVVSTPSLQYFSKVNKVSALMITASHNPYYYNGIKIFINGEKLEKEQEELIEANIENDNEVLSIGKYSKSNIVINQYLEHLLEIKEESKFKIALDLANGATINIANELFKNEMNLTLINNYGNGININDNCGSLYINEINLENNDYLFSFDGDGDRVLFKDNERVYDGDLIVYLLARFYNEKKVVLTKNVNLGVLKAFKKHRIKVCISEIGDKNVYDLMIKENVLIGGETSGHIINLKYMNSGDGLLNFLLINKILNKVNLQELLKDVDYYPSLDLNLNVDYPLEILEEIKTKYLKKARVNIRRSGTEKVIRVNICSKKEEIIEKIKKEIIERYRDE